jgi:hypothetical protein
MSADVLTVAITAPVTVTRSAFWRVIFTNAINLGFGDNDVRITFGFDQDLTKPGQHILEEAVVVMALRNVKLLSHSLNLVISQFEAANGPIPVPLDKLQRLDAEISAQAEANRQKRGEQKPGS